MQPGQKAAGNFSNFSKKSALQVLGYPGLDTVLNTSRFEGGITFLIAKIAQGLFYHLKSNDRSLDKTSFEFFQGFVWG